MAKQFDAKRLMESYIGRTISTVRGAPNTVLRIQDDSVIVKTDRSPNGKPAPIDHVQMAIETLLADGTYPFKVPFRRSRKYRGSFYFAVLLSLPGVAKKGIPC
jgi:hypothetical protein